MKREVVVRLGVFANEALSGEEEESGPVSSRLTLAMRAYLRDKDANRPGWRYPDFARDNGSTRTVEVSVSIDDELWSAFEAEAAEQGVSTEQLAEHAALYFAAGIDSGIATKRILDRIDDA